MRSKTQKLYSSVKDLIPSFKERQGQIDMINVIDTSFEKAHAIELVNAPTGSGKTLAYLIGALPNSPDKQIVICTGTVALQEQIIKKDLPLINKALGGNLEYAIAKGKGRFMCQQALDAKMSKFAINTSLEKEVFSLVKLLNDNAWEGDFDQISAVNPKIKSMTSCEGVSCKPHICPYATKCAFAKKSAKLKSAKVIVTNYNYLLTDLKKEDDHKILPLPNKGVWIFDEGDLLPEKLSDNFHGTFNTDKAIFILKKCQTAIKKSGFSARVKQKHIAESVQFINTFIKMKDYFDRRLHKIDRKKGVRYKKGEISAKLMNVVERVETISLNLKRFHGAVTEHEKELSKERKGKMVINSKPFSELSRCIEDTLVMTEGFQSEYIEDPHAKFIEYKKGWEFNSFSLDYGKEFYKEFWSELTESHCIITSATLKILGGFEHFIEKSGLKQCAPNTHEIDTCFDYQKNMLIRKTSRICTPKNTAEFEKQLIETIPNILKKGESTLIIFTSKALMNKAYNAMPEHLKSDILLQGQKSVNEIVREHKGKCDNNQPSAIFGLKSFATGVDLPKHYCKNVVVTKLDFPVPTGHLDEAHAEFAKFNGDNPFYAKSLPEATKILIQTVGRLIRTEEDKGTLYLCDVRLWNSSYGKLMTKDLPKGRWQ